MIAIKRSERVLAASNRVSFATAIAGRSLTWSLNRPERK
jgi:hypothetical protein